MLRFNFLRSIRARFQSNLAPRRRGRRFYEALEKLEERQLFSIFTSSLAIAPNGSSATFTDVDGDLVTVAVSKGTLVAGDLVTTTPANLHDQLQMLTLTDPAFTGANVTISVKKAGGGDGLTNVGEINATGIDLGAVKITGDLGRILAGDTHTTTSGLTSLSVTTMGRDGLDSQAVGGSMESDIVGNLGALSIAHDFTNAYIKVLRGADALNASIGAITIGGSVIGGAADDSARILATGNIGVAKISGDVIGGAGSRSATISSGEAFAGVTVGGSVIGGAGYESAAIFTGNGDMGNMIIGGSLVGEGGAYSGYIGSYSSGVGNVSIGGSIVGAAGNAGGLIRADGGGIGALTVAGDVTGQTAVFANAAIKSITIGGSLSGQIQANGALGTIKIAGNFSGTLASFGQTVGNVTIGGAVSGTINAGDSIKAISAGGDMTGSFSSTVGAIGNVTIGGSMLDGTVHGHTGIGAIAIARNFSGGDINTDGAAIKSLTVGGSMGINANFTAGALGITKISGDCDVNFMQVTGALAGMTVGGNFDGYLHAGSCPGTFAIGRDDTGSLDFDNGAGTVSVGGTLRGVLQAGVNIATLKVGDDLTGNVELVNCALGTVLVSGSIMGDVSNYSGFIDAGTIGKLTVGHSIVGGAGYLTGVVRSRSTIGSVSIGGSIVGGVFSDSGMIIASSIGTVKVARDITREVDDTGQIVATGTGMGAVTIGGNVSGTINSAGMLASLTIGGDFSGNLNASTTLGTTKISGDASGIINAGYMTAVSIGRSFVNGQLTAADIGALSIGGAMSGGQIDVMSSMGAFTVAQSLAGSVVVGGKMTAFKIGGSVTGYLDAGGHVGSITIGGTLVGGSARNSGFIHVDTVTTVKIGGGILGGGNTDAGTFYTEGLGTASIGGSIVGGSGVRAGVFDAVGSAGTLTVVGSIRGGSAPDAGLLYAGTSALVTIGGSVIGTSSDTGAILGNTFNAVTIKQNLVGGDETGSGTMIASGVIVALNRIGSVLISGSIIAGQNSGSGVLSQSGAIVARDDIGAVTVKGSLVGNEAGGNISAVLISARGQAVQGATTDVAIGTITIGGRMELANILAGYGTDGSASNGDAQINSVKVGGDFIASNIVAGIENAGSDNTNFGNGGDTSIGAGNANITATIGNVTIGGIAQGTPASTNSSDHFGIVSQIVGPVTVNGTLVTLAPDVPLGTTGDMDIVQI